MKKLLVCLFISTLIFSCQEVPKTENQSKKELEKPLRSEMSALMQRMFLENKIIKEQIEQGNSNLGFFPTDYLKIHSAVLTDPSDMDDIFKECANNFITAQQRVFSENENSKENFNRMVNTCIACHQQKCPGPIRRIKKLYLK
ncbi:MAG: hypothetical protein IPI59_00310 [Sphingobacteriales bacterium]|jgi:cytochrome c553|nr:hypothetical protein [Sphingobacteriales bacterium]MBP9141071.1 hypothetical protein [Chitinophagales bacterium]MDA0198293.1 hypothetical protein [Bacteroidota bacterium]MBK6890934.1 hypothetical protein [Sphingobacteriales bacterium]MBK7526016.1 hypothetical protein [Sphingobacteriales bacterium]